MKRFSNRVNEAAEFQSWKIQYAKCVTMRNMEKKLSKAKKTI